MTDAPDLELPNFLTFRFARLQSHLNTQAMHLLKAHSAFSLTEWRVVSLIQMYGETSLSEIARACGLDKGQLSRSVSALVDRGYVESKQDPGDHRHYVLSLTQLGQDGYERTRPHMQARQKALEACLGAEELRVLLGAMSKLEAQILGEE